MVHFGEKKKLKNFHFCSHMCKVNFSVSNSNVLSGTWTYKRLHKSVNNKIKKKHIFVVISKNTKTAGQEHMNLLQTFAQVNPGIKIRILREENWKIRWLDNSANTLKHDVPMRYKLYEWFTPHLIYKNTQHTSIKQPRVMIR